MSKKNGMADPSRLKPVYGDDKQLLRVIVETPKGSRNKFAFDQDQHIFELKKVLPAGMAFPYDFGFVPSTEADDGDPVDVLVLMDEPAFPGCTLKCRRLESSKANREMAKGRAKARAKGKNATIASLPSTRARIAGLTSRRLTILAGSSGAS